MRRKDSVMKKRILSVLLIVLTLLNTIPFISASANEVSYSGSDFSSNAKIASILDEIFAEYVPGKHYFVSDGGDNLNGNKNLPCTAYGNDCGYYSRSWQCLAYVRWAQNKLFGFDEWNYDLFYEIKGYSYATETNCRNWFQTNKNKLHPGAHIRFANHSILYLSQDSNGVTFLHCNWGKTCMVKFATLSWADFASLFGYINYCTYYKDYYSVYPENVSTPLGTYRTNTPGSTLNFRTEPTTASSVIASISHNTEVVVTKTQGNWGYITLNGNSGWISLDFAELVEPFSYNVEYISDNEIADSKVAFGSTMIVEINTDQKSGYAFSGWSVQRKSDSKWYTDNGWFTEAELATNGYMKTLFTSGDRIVVGDKWVSDVTKEETFTFHANWEEARYGIYRVATPGDALNLRSQATTSSTVLTLIPDGTELEITIIQGSWGYTSYNSLKGWVSLNFVEFLSPLDEVKALVVTKAPTKTQYYIGEKFNPSGMVVEVEYADGSRKEINDYIYSTDFFLTAGKNSVVISYRDLKIYTDVTVLANPEIKILDSQGIYGSSVSVPINVTADSYIGNGEFIISYDSSVLEYSGYKTDLLSDSSVNVDGSYKNGKIKITFSSDSPITLGGALLCLNFNIKSLTSKTSVTMDSMSLYTTTNNIAPSAFTNATVSIFSQVTSYEKLFKSITHALDGENIVFTVVTPATSLNRVKVTLADDKGGYIKYTDSYTLNSDGDYVWTLKLPCPESVTVYAFDARSSETKKYLKDYAEYEVSTTKPNAIKSVSAEKNGSKTVFTVITTAGSYNRLRIGLSEGLTDNLGVSSSYSILANGDYSWTITITSPLEGTVLYFDLRNAETNKYSKNCYEYTLDLMEDVITDVSAVKKDNKLVFTVISKSGDYSRLRVGLNTNLTDNLAVSTKYGTNQSGNYVWTISIDIPKENTALYFDLRDAVTNKYINNHYVFNFDAAQFSDNVIKSVTAQQSGGKTTFTVITAAGNYSRLRVGTNETLTNNLAVSTKYTVNPTGNYVWSITIPTPDENIPLYFDLRDASTNKYIGQHYIYNS